MIGKRQTVHGLVGLNLKPTALNDSAALPRCVPDSITAELWAEKARMNAEAGYHVDR